MQYKWCPVLCLILYLCFLFYVSLVPFEYSSGTLAAAWSKAFEQPGSLLPAFSEADFVANILLGIPLGLLLIASFPQRRRPALQAVLGAAALLLAVVASLGLEFFQLPLHTRIASWYDVLAQGAGALGGIILWTVLRPSISGLLDPVQFTPRASGVHVLLLAYLLFLFLSNLLPLDFSLSPAEIFSKWEQGQ